MIVDVAVRYKAKVKRHGGRDFKDENFSCVVPVEIRELSGSEAPVAVRYDEPVDSYAKHALDDVRPVELRDLGGRLGRMVQGRDGDGDVVLATCDAAWLARVSSLEDRTSHGPFRHLAGWHGHVPAPLMEDVRIRAVESSGRRDVEAEAHRVAQGIASVDGVLWKACDEPRLVVDGRGRGGVLQGWVRSSPSSSDLSVPSSTFRLDESELVTRLHEPLVEFGITLRLPRVEVFMPELLRYRASEAALHEAATQLVDWMGRDLKTKPLPYMAAFVGLRDAVPEFARALEDGADVDVEGLAALLETTLAEYRHVEGERGATPAAGSAVHRWREAASDPRDVVAMRL